MSSRILSASAPAPNPLIATLATQLMLGWIRSRRNYYHFLPGGTIPGLDPNLYYQAPRERVPPRTLRLGLIFRF